MNSRALFVLLLAVLIARPADANEDGIYESLGRIPIGRVFLTPGEREQLDKTRGKRPARSVSAPAARPYAVRAGKPEAAGFIISDSGKTRVWKDGNFVAADSAADVRFPQRVRVTSRRKAKLPEQSPGDGDSGTSHAGS